MTIRQKAEGFLRALDEHPHVFTDVPGDRLRADADAADARRENRARLSPLDGQFLAVKANIDVQGLSSHAGSRLFRPEPAPRDAPIVARLRRAGLVVIGHANMSEFAFSGLGTNPHFGTPPNALNHTVVPGGSSSGSATAVATGMADLALGTDTSGSVRIPAACQGIVGFRPSIGRYDDTGVFPLATTLDTLGPLARQVQPIQTLDQILVGDHAPGQPCTRIICFDNRMLAGFSAEICAMYRAAVNQLAATEMDLELRSIRSFAQIDALFQRHGTLVGAEAYRLLQKVVPTDHPDLDPRVAERLAHSAAIDDGDIQKLLAARQVAIREFAAELDGAMLLYPTLMSVPPSLHVVTRDAGNFAQENARILSLPMKAAFLNAPTISLPVGSGAPGYSVSLTAPTGNDRHVLATVARLETVLARAQDR